MVTACSKAIIIAMLPMLAMLPPVERPQAVEAGPYHLEVESVGQVLDFTRPVEERLGTVIDLAVSAEGEELGKLLEVAHNPTVCDESGNGLAFQQIRYPENSTATDGKGKVSKIRLQLWFAAPRTFYGENSCLRDLKASLLRYEKRETVWMDFLSVAGEEPGGQTYESLRIKPRLRRTEERGRRLLEVTLDIRPARESGFDPSVHWMNEQVELIDAQGVAVQAIATARTYEYDGEGKMTGRKITAQFTEPKGAARGVRFRAERLSGMETLEYKFEYLPLP